MRTSVNSVGLHNWSHYSMIAGSGRVIEVLSAEQARVILKATAHGLSNYELNLSRGNIKH